jgi:Sulfotransferase family
VAGELGFDAKVLLEEAERRAGARDFGDPAFVGPMQRLLAALEREAELNPAGRLGQQERIVGLLVNRLRTEESIRRHPEILEERIEAPIVIVGLARTGTTMLHRMLASDPRLHALLWWESRQPASPLDLPASAPDPRIADAEREVEAMLGASPELIAAHPMDAHAPDEEIMLVEHSFLSTNPEAFCRIPSFAAWRESQDLTPGYDYLLRLLRFLQWQKRRRGERGQRWILKTPFHLGHMDVLFRTFPDVRIVWPHREPGQCIPSLASLIHSLRVLSSDRVDPIEVGCEWSGKFQRAIGRCMDVREAHPDRFLDLRYEDLIADPLAQAARIYAFAGLSFDEEVAAGMRRWAVENAREKRPVHRYTQERFGLDEAGLRRDFARYRERFLVL